MMAWVLVSYILAIAIRLSGLPGDMWVRLLPGTAIVAIFHAVVVWRARRLGAGLAASAFCSLAALIFAFSFIPRVVLPSIVLMAGVMALVGMAAERGLRAVGTSH